MPWKTTLRGYPSCLHKAQNTGGNTGTNSEVAFLRASIMAESFFFFYIEVQESLAETPVLYVRVRLDAHSDLF